MKEIAPSVKEERNASEKERKAGRKGKLGDGKERQSEEPTSKKRNGKERIKEE